jgi:taurine dioxygenase
MPDVAVDVLPVSGSLGAEVRGMHLGMLEPEDVALIRQLLHEHLVLFFPGQDLSVDEHYAFAEALGEVYQNPPTASVFANYRDDDAAHPGLSVHRSHDGYRADSWHSDGQARSMTPPVKFTIFKMIRCPNRGGDTMWANQHAAYEQLSAPMRDLLDGLTAFHAADSDPTEYSTRPAVLTHPETGRKLLYLTRSHTKRLLELSEPESDALLHYLLDFAVRPEIVCRYRWTPGTVGIWDNLATQHYGVYDIDGPREFHRVMVAGPELPATVDRWPRLKTLQTA